jgi:hypothetical protein
VFTFIEALVESAAMGVFEATLPSFFLFGTAAIGTSLLRQTREAKLEPQSASPAD